MKRFSRPSSFLNVPTDIQAFPDLVVDILKNSRELREPSTHRKLRKIVDLKNVENLDILDNPEKI